LTVIERCSRLRNRLLDLSDVTFVDSEGKQLLALIYRQGAEFQAAGCITKCIVDEIVREQRA
jgi:anti-anti-sigma regulatory factor